jgi:hypothetical protein
MSTYREDMRRAWDRINSFPTQRLQTRFGTIEYADHRGTSVSATMSFDELGRLTDFIAPRYRHLGKGRFSLEEWATPTDHGEVDGLRLPTAGRAEWHLDSGDLTYAVLRIT